MVMPAWYDIKDITDRSSRNSLNLKHILESNDRITKVMDKEIELLGDSKKLFIGGFSQGGAMALMSGLEYKKQLGGILIFSGYLLDCT